MPSFRIITAAAALTAAGATAGFAWADPTPVTVRVMVADGKFIGDAMGGARVVVRDAETGVVLAEGITEGGSGDTRRLVEAPRARDAQLTRPEDAKFEAVLDIDRPTRVTVEVAGPRFLAQSEARSSMTQWVLPGRSPHGPDGWIVQLAGLSIDLISPTLYDRTVEAGEQVVIEANVMVLCGCGIEPGGTWDADRYEVVYRLGRPSGEVLSEGPMTYAGEVSRYAATAPGVLGGTYQLTVTARDRLTGSAGVDFGSLSISQ